MFNTYAADFVKLLTVLSLFTAASVSSISAFPYTLVLLLHNDSSREEFSMSGRRLTKTLRTSANIW